MTAQAFQNPLPTFTGSNGLPLASGYVYFGVANQDPRQYPVAVYYDQALTLLAIQPMRTSAGCLFRNGAPTNVWIDGDYSLMVLDSAGRQVFYTASWFGASAATMGYTPAGSGAVATSIQSKLREGVSVFDFMTAAQIADVQAGTQLLDVVAPIQAAINAAIYNASVSSANGLKAVVFVPAGIYKCSGPLHLGYGTSFTSVALEGAGLRYNGQAAFSGTALVFTHKNAPGIVVQGSRYPLISRMTIVGANYNYIVANNKGTSAGTDSDLTASTWVDPTFPASASSQYAPYAAIAVDPYSGVRPGTSYPNVSYPAFLGAVAQYGKNFSSGVTIEDVQILGFVVGVVVQPGDSDGNGDYTKLNRVAITCCQYALSICQSQSRLVHLNDCNIAQVHTAIVTTKHGRQIGKPAILAESTEFNALIQMVDIPNLSYGGMPRFISCYGEQMYSIGVAGSGSSNNSAISFDSCEFAFTLQVQRGVPAYVFIFNGQGHAAFRECLFNEGPVGHYAFFGAFGAKSYIFDGCLVSMTPITTLYQMFSAQATGGITVSQLGTDFSTFTVHPTGQWNLDTGVAVNPRLLSKENTGSRATCLPVATRRALPSAYASDPGAPAVIRSTLLGKGALVFSTSGREVTFDTGLAASVWAISQRGLGVGDLCWDDVTGVTFKIKSRIGGVIKMEAVSGYNSAGNLLTAMTTVGTLYFLNCRVYTPTAPLYADTTAANAVASNVDDGNTSGTFINTDITVGDYVYYIESGDTMGAENALQITARDGAARTITVTGTFRRTATYRRIALFVRAEAPNA